MPRARPIGVIQVLNRKGGYFSQEDDELLEALAAQAAMAIENRNQLLCSRTEDFREGMRAFIEKRDPVYTGR